MQQKKPPRISDVSIEDLKAVMREELERFKSQTGMKTPTSSVSSELDLFGPSDELGMFTTIWNKINLVSGNTKVLRRVAQSLCSISAIFYFTVWPTLSDNNNDYEDLYATLKALPRAPSPPAPGAPGPPLPPRNDALRPGTQTLALRALDSAIGKDVVNFSFIRILK